MKEPIGPEDKDIDDRFLVRHLKAMREIIQSDSYAAGFTDLASYRSALLTVFDGSSLDLNRKPVIPTNQTLDREKISANLSPVALARIRRYALAATPGPWEVDSDIEPELVHTVHSHTTTYGHDYAVVPKLIQDKLFIAAANPHTVLALLDRLEAQARVIEASVRHGRPVTADEADAAGVAYRPDGEQNESTS